MTMDTKLAEAATVAASAAPDASAHATTASAVSDGSAAQAASNEVTAATQPVDAEDEDEDEEVMTLHDVLQEQNELDEAAEAVLGDASDDNCSYEMGYYRQALYACLTCTPGPFEEGRVAGVCLACSYHCHGDHELVELYTKRDFRCDCGNSRFPEQSKCVLFAEKDLLNERNKYSQNFVGMYCGCHRPYPDPERTTPEIMVQCIVCEDWLHDEHIFPSENAPAATQEKMPSAFDELICMPCMAKHPFLMAYQLLQNHEENDGDDDHDSEAPGVEVAEGQCVLEALQARLTETEAAVRPTFWSGDWRSRLCGCSKCVARMEKQRIAFLMDPEDSLQAYEARTRQQQQELHGVTQSTTTTSTTTTTSSTTTTTTTNVNGDEEAVVSSTVASAMSTMEQAAQRAFQSKLTHEQQVELAVGYNHMKEKLQTYLATFAASGKTVRAPDIQAFFAELNEAKETKRQRLN